MMTRRELLGSGALGGAGRLQQPPAIDRRVLDELVARLDAIADELVVANRGCSTGVCPVAGKIRDAFVLFLRANNKFPDFLEVGAGTFFEMYDWHVRNQQPLNVGRATDGRYGLAYLFTRLILRPDAVPDYIGVPYDLRG